MRILLFFGCVLFVSPALQLEAHDGDKAWPGTASGDDQRVAADHAEPKAAMPTFPAVEPLIQYWERSFRVTEDQKNALREIRNKAIKAEQDALQRTAEKRREAGDAMIAAQHAADQRAAAKASDAYAAACRPVFEIHERYYQQQQDVLTAEQKKQLEENLPALAIEDKTEPVKLSPQQIARVKARFSETEKAQGRDAAMMKLSDLVLPVLTRQQKTAILSGRAARVSKELLEPRGSDARAIRAR